MGLSFTDGNITSSASEQTIFNISADEHFASWIFCHNMTGADVITIKVYVRDNNTGPTDMKVYISKSVAAADVSAAPSIFIPFVSTKQYKVTIQRTGGSDRNYTWSRVEVT